MRLLHLYAPFQSDSVLPAIQDLRTECYRADGAVREDEYCARDNDDSDWHIVATHNDAVIGCISMRQPYNSTSFVHSWALHKDHRKTRAGIELALACFAWADMVGVCYAKCYATERNNSALILEKLGGLASNWIYDEDYKCNMRTVCFWPSKLSPKHRESAKRVKARLVQSQCDRAVEGPLSKTNDSRIVA